MARGITEDDVHTAADALVAAGERPTVERIRGHLGTGSPNTVVRWLETWWQGLAPRLQHHQARLEVPGAPEPVAELAGKWWQAALEHANALAREALVIEREEVEASREALRRDREDFEQEAVLLRQQEASALHARDLASVRTGELERLVRQLEEQVGALGAQCEATRAREEASERRCSELERQLQALQQEAASEREAMAQHVRAAEDRAHAEVDRARQETRDLKQQLMSFRKERAADEKADHKRMEEVRLEASEALREAAIQRARAEALEGQLTQLRDLPAALESVLQQAKARPRKVAKRSTPAVKRKSDEAKTRKTTAVP